MFIKKLVHLSGSDSCYLCGFIDFSFCLEKHLFEIISLDAL